jgi:hypothetical protein
MIVVGIWANQSEPIDQESTLFLLRTKKRKVPTQLFNNAENDVPESYNRTRKLTIQSTAITPRTADGVTGGGTAFDWN